MEYALSDVAAPFIGVCVGLGALAYFYRDCNRRFRYSPRRLALMLTVAGILFSVVTCTWYAVFSPELVSLLQLTALMLMSFVMAIVIAIVALHIAQHPEAGLLGRLANRCLKCAPRSE